MVLLNKWKSFSETKRIVIIIMTIFCIGMIYAGITIFSFIFTGNKMMDQTYRFWGVYEKQSPSYYEEFSKACDSILAAYGKYVDYPFDIKIEANPAIPAIIIATDPKAITIWSKDHISVLVVTIADSDDMGYHIIWKRSLEDPSKWDLFLGPNVHEGPIVYTKHK